MAWYNFFKSVGRFLTRALSFVETYVTDENIEMALAWARVAAAKFSSNDARREFVVSMLVSRGVPENIARLAVEIAVGLLKKEQTEEESA